MVRRSSLLVLLAPLTLGIGDAAAQTLFAETWDDGQGASRWSSPLLTLETPSLGFDGSVNYAFDYSTLGAPSSPGSLGGSTTGLFMEANTTDQTSGGEGESVGVVPLGFTLPDTNFRLTAEMYLFWNFESGSTEYGTLGVHHGGGQNVPFRFEINDGEGLAWQLNTDGDTSSDLIAFEEFGGQASLGTWQAIPNGTIPGVPTGSASQVGAFNRWVELAIESVNGEVTFAINGVEIDTFDNSGGTYTGGSVLLGHSDPFNSVNPDNGAGLSNGVVFDNVTVTAVTPPLVGDYNGNGAVDAADYTVWRDTLGDDDFEAGTGADGDGDGFISRLDYDEWADNFGATAAAAAVPEPAAFVLVGIAVVGLVARR